MKGDMPVRPRNQIAAGLIVVVGLGGGLGVGTAHAARPRAAAAAAWTPERVLSFVLETHALVDREVRKAYKSFDGRRALGQCYGEPAKGLVKAAAVRPVLESRIEGKALQCYVASYFGCRLGDWLAVAGVALRGPSHLPHAGSAARLIEQTTTQVTAEVTEVSSDILKAGVVDPTRIPAGKTVADFSVQTQYTIARASKGAWKIADRVPAAGDWECRDH
jgi:hypothetical protein